MNDKLMGVEGPSSSIVLRINVSECTASELRECILVLGAFLSIEEEKEAKREIKEGKLADKADAIVAKVQKP